MVTRLRVAQVATPFAHGLLATRDRPEQACHQCSGGRELTEQRATRSAFRTDTEFSNIQDSCLFTPEQEVRGEIPNSNIQDYFLGLTEKNVNTGAAAQSGPFTAASSRFNSSRGYAVSWPFRTEGWEFIGYFRECSKSYLNSAELPAVSLIEIFGKLAIVAPLAQKTIRTITS